MMRPSSSFHRGLLILVMLLGITATCRADSSGIDEQWYVIQLAGQRAGWMHASTETTDDHITTRGETRLSIRRGAIQIDIEIDTEFIETSDGKPIRAETRQKLGGADVRQIMDFHDDHIDMTNIQGAQQTQSTIPQPEGGFFPPAAAEREMRSKFDQGATKVTLRTMDPTAGPMAIEVTTTRGARTTVDVFGRQVPATEMFTTLSIMPNVVNREYVDDQGVMVRSAMAILPGMELQILAADEALAKAQLNPPELMADTLVAPDRPIPNARDTRQAKYRLRFVGKIDADADADADANANINADEFSAPTIGYQQAVSDGENAVIVTVDIDGQASASDPPPTDAHRSASIMLNSDDPEIRKLTEQALAETEKANDLTRAKRLRDFTRAHIDAKDLSVGFATASEVARTGQGDCSEHAVLLAAMLRAAQIPSRTVSGVVYVPRFLNRQDVFGYHMWTQAWVATDDAPEGRWIDLDAAIGDRDFDAAHIALSHSAMEDAKGMNDMMALMPLIGTLRIEVLETSP